MFALPPVTRALILANVGFKEIGERIARLSAGFGFQAFALPVAGLFDVLRCAWPGLIEGISLFSE